MSDQSTDNPASSPVGRRERTEQGPTDGGAKDGGAKERGAKAGRLQEGDLLVVISGPSGVGKSTITHHVEKRLGAVFSVSMTTRPRTEADIEGRDYYFVDEDEFNARIERGDMLEWAKVFDHHYGTPRRAVDLALHLGRVVLLEIDVEGAAQIKANLPEVLTLFVLPPDEPALLERLRRRNREGEQAIQTRFARAKAEIARAHDSGVYEHFITNNQLDQAVDQAVRLIQTRRSKP